MDARIVSKIAKFVKMPKHAKHVKMGSILMAIHVNHAQEFRLVA